MGDRYTTSAVEEQTFEDSKVGLSALVARTLACRPCFYME